MSNCENDSNRVTFDPGWNDPPNLSYGTQQPFRNRPRNILNKRVAFPLSGNNSRPAMAVSSPNLPPITTTITPATLMMPKNVPDIDCNIDEESTLREVKEALISILENFTELGSKATDIRKRIDVMEDMWLSGKLNNRIQLLMKELVQALQKDKPGEADNIHKALMVDHVSAVSSWMPGIKQLIYHDIARTELLAIDDEEI